MTDRRIGNKNDICREFGVAPTTVNYWLLHGLPYVTKGERGKAYEFDLDEVKGWIEERGEKTHATRSRSSESADHRARLLKHKADLAEMEVMERAGALVSAEDMEREIYHAAREVRLAMEQMADEVAAELAVMTDELEVRNKLAEEIGRAMQALVALHEEMLRQNEESREKLADGLDIGGNPSELEKAAPPA